MDEKMKTEMEPLNSYVDSIRMETQVLKERVKVLEGQVLENERKLEEKRVIWQLCSRHESNGKALGCSQKQDGVTCPFYATSAENLLDILINIPKAFEAFLQGLNLGDVMNCRTVCKTLKSLVDNYFKYSLLMAAARGDVKRVKKLIAAGANVNTALTIIDDDHDHKILHGYKVDMIDMSPLAMAACSSRPQHVEIGKLLIRAGASLQAAGKGMSPLFAATFNGGEFSGPFLEMIIEAGAEVDGSNFCGPLLGAIGRIEKMPYKNWPVENIKILVRAGADVCQYDCLDKTSAFDCLLKALIWRAIKVGLGKLEEDLELVDMFLAAGAESPFGLARAPMADQIGEYARWRFHIQDMTREFKSCENQTEATRIGKIKEKAMTRIAQHLGISKKCLEVFSYDLCKS